MSSQGPIHSLASMAPDLSAGTISPPGQRHHDGAQPPKHLGAGPCHPVAQPLEPLRRGDLAGEPAAHLATGAAAEQRLDVELSAERVPQLLAAAVLDPCEQFVRGETKGMAEKKWSAGDFACEVALERVIHVGDAGPDRVEGLERAHQCAGRKDLDLDAPAAGVRRSSARSGPRWSADPACLRASRSPS